MPKANLFGIEVCDLRASFPDRPGWAAGYTHPPAGIIGVSQHHGGVSPNGSSLRDDLLYLQSAYEHDLQFGGFAYHLVASPAGRLFWTRNLETWGCHTAGMNDRLLGVMAIGDYRRQKPSDALLCALSLAWVALWRWCDGLRIVQAHQQWGVSTECCGAQLIAEFPRILQFAAFNAQRYPQAPAA